MFCGSESTRGVTTSHDCLFAMGQVVWTTLAILAKNGLWGGGLRVFPPLYFWSCLDEASGGNSGNIEETSVKNVYFPNAYQYCFLKPRLFWNHPWKTTTMAPLQTTVHPHHCGQNLGANQRDANISGLISWSILDSKASKWPHEWRWQKPQSTDFWQQQHAAVARANQATCTIGLRVNISNA